MRNFLAFVGAAVIVVLALGWYLGWYNVTPQKSGPGQSRLQVDINQDKIGKDVKEGVQKGTEKVQDLLEKNKQDGTANPDSRSGASLSPPANDPGKPSKRSEDTFKNFIVDGWFSGEKK